MKFNLFKAEKLKIGSNTLQTWHYYIPMDGRVYCVKMRLLNEDKLFVINEYVYFFVTLSQRSEETHFPILCISLCETL